MKEYSQILPKKSFRLLCINNKNSEKKRFLDNTFQGGCVKLGHERPEKSEKTFYAAKNAEKKENLKEERRKNMSE